MEKRQFSRVSFISQCFASFSGNKLEAVVQDISLKGALLELQSNDAPAPQLNDEVEIEIKLNEDVHFELISAVRFQKEQLIGVEFQGLNIDALTELKRLMELNLGSEELINREIEALVRFYSESFNG